MSCFYEIINTKENIVYEKQVLLLLIPFLNSSNLKRKKIMNKYKFEL